MSNIVERIIPHSVEAEQCVIGSVLLSDTAIDSISELLPEHFYVEAHREIFRIIRQMAHDAHRIDVVTLAERIGDAGLEERTGGLAYLGELAMNTPGAAGVVRYSTIVRERSIERQLLSACSEILEVTNGVGPVKDKLDSAQRVILAISESRTGRQPRVLGDALTDFLDRTGRRMSGVERAMPTGIETLDERLGGGLHDGNLVIIAGRPSMGKSALSGTIAINVALTGTPVSILSMEMTEDEQIDRVIAFLGRVPLDEVLKGNLTGEEGERITAAVGKAQSLPLVIGDEGGMSILDVMSSARSMKRKFGMRLLVIDALGLMAYDSTRTVTELGAITRALKALAKELSIPIILLCQLSRKCEERTDKRPVMSDLRDSGNIEQDADVVLMLYREEYYNPGTPDKGIAEVLVRKSRQGRTGTVPMSFRGEFMHFGALERGWSPKDTSNAGHHGKPSGRMGKYD